MKKQETHKQMR